jgi:hypothetical protein
VVKDEKRSGGKNKRKNKKRVMPLLPRSFPFPQAVIPYPSTSGVKKTCKDPAFFFPF